MPDAVRLGVRGRTARGLPSGKGAFGGYGLGVLVCVWLGLVWARCLAPSLLSAAAVGVPSKAPGVRAGPVPRSGGLPEAVAWLAGAAAAVPCPLGAPHGGGAVGAAVWAAGAASRAGAGSETGCSGRSGPPGAARPAA